MSYELATISIDPIDISPMTAVIVFAPGAVQTLIERIEREARAVETDISTPRGRKDVASLAYKVARSKTALDKMGKDLTDEWRGRTNAVNEERRLVRDRLDALAEEVRKPLTDWERAEATRIAGHEAALAEIAGATVFALPDPTVSEIDARLVVVHDAADREWQEFAKRGVEAVTAAVARLTSMRAAAEERAAQQAEFARLQAEEAERTRQAAIRAQEEREAQIAAQAAERARVVAEERAATVAKQEAERVEAARQAAERRAALEAQRATEAAQAERRRVDQERQAAEARAAQMEAQAQRAEASRLAAIAKAETDRVAAAERAERERMEAVQAEQKRLANIKAAEEAETARRVADKAHRGKINTAVVAGLVATGLTTEQAKAVVVAVARGAVAHLSIGY